MESSYMVVRNKGESKYNGHTKRSNVPSSISLRGSSFEDVFVEYAASQKVSNSNGHYADDETIDARAASYISYVQERFKRC
ncbi:hypothetical protein PanWU01x14_028890 [Parasponia andersonii]|uniref:Uncharacterized protein n=1 Tax=Parasponia andersonii TaxID=3476 RepID=A0A2P5DVG5_PARAD|nr:hypothetical protein PanWU01x14_028890 [Parasponia andersonii]